MSEDKTPRAWFTIDELNAWADKKLKDNPQWAEQPAQQQEPVAWMWKDGTITSDPDRADGTWMPLYTTPPASKPCKVWDAEGYDALCQQLEGWKAKASKPLTDDEIYKLCRNEGDEHSTCFIFNKDGTWSVLTLARAIEAAHGIKGETQ